MSNTEAPAAVRDRLALALDVDDLFPIERPRGPYRGDAPVLHAHVGAPTGASGAVHDESVT